MDIEENINNNTHIYPALFHLTKNL